MPRRRRADGRPARLLTLSTDIGWAYAAQMKAVLLRSLSPGTVVDLTHELRPHAVLEASFLLEHMASGFPAGTVHVGIVDPGVGGERAPVAIATRDGSVLVGPDNGVLGPLARRLGFRSAVRLDPGRIVGSARPSATFEGRDLFAPAAALLALGTPLERLGRPFRPKLPALPRPRRTPEGASGEILHIDRFGNLISNVPTEWAPERAAVAVALSARPARRLRRVRTYSELRPEEIGLIGSSFGRLEIARREGSVADRLGASVGERLRLAWAAERRPRAGSG